MLRWIKQLDSILRGQATRLAALQQGTIELSAAGLSVVLVLLGMLYGLCMGLFSVLASKGSLYQQLLATTVKVPALFFLTLLVTFPSLYVFNALVGSRLSLTSVLRLLIAAMGVMLAVLASFGTIVAFFSVCTDSYPFMILLNVLVFAISGFLGLAFLLQTLHRLTLVQQAPLEAPPPLPQVPSDDPLSAEAAPTARQGALDNMSDQVPSRHVRTIFQIWIIVFGLVGAQMGWVLRPFIGHPGIPFTWFRPRTSNFFEAVWHALQRLLGA